MTQFVSSKRPPSSWNKPDIPDILNPPVIRPRLRRCLGVPKKSAIWKTIGEVSVSTSLFFFRKVVQFFFWENKKKRAKNPTNGYICFGKKIPRRVGWKPNIVSAGKHIFRLVKLKPGAWEWSLISTPIGSMYSYIYQKNQPNVGKYTIHGWYAPCPVSNALELFSGM